MRGAAKLSVATAVFVMGGAKVGLVLNKGAKIPALAPSSSSRLGHTHALAGSEGCRTDPCREKETPAQRKPALRAAAASEPRPDSKPHVGNEPEHVVRVTKASCRHGPCHPLFLDANAKAQAAAVPMPPKGAAETLRAAEAETLRDLDMEFLAPRQPMTAATFVALASLAGATVALALLSLAAYLRGKDDQVHLHTLGQPLATILESPEEESASMDWAREPVAKIQQFQNMKTDAAVCVRGYLSRVYARANV